MTGQSLDPELWKLLYPDLLDPVPAVREPAASPQMEASPMPANGQLSLQLEHFLGEWRDSMGNRVQVDWSRMAGKGGQLDVLLVKPRGGRDPIRLNVKQLGPDRFMCGHYDLEVEKSSLRRIVWGDCRHRGQSSVWER